MGCCSARCRRRSARRCSRCRWRARCRWRSGPGFSAAWRRALAIRPSWPNTSGCSRQGTARILDVIATLGHVKQNPDGRYEMTASGRRWLDPRSDTYVGDFVADTYNYWDWYAGLEDLVRDGKHVELHEESSRRPLLAVLHPRPVPAGAALQRRGREDDSARAGRALAARRRRRPRRVLDGALSAARGDAGDDRRPARQRRGSARRSSPRRGWPTVCATSSATCSRSTTTVTTTSPSASTSSTTSRRSRPGRCSRGSARCCGPGRRSASSISTTGRRGQQADLASILGLFFHLTSGADTYTTGEVSRWMGESGYGSVEIKSFRTLPDLRLLVAKAV